MKSLLYFIAFTFSISAQGQIADPDFENWYVDTNGKKQLISWEHLTPLEGPGGLQGTWQDSATSQSGQKAVILSRWYNYTWDVLKQRAPISYKPAVLKGYYKYVDNDLIGGWATKDTALAEVFVTAWNSALNKRDTVGTGRRELTVSNSYSLFNCPISYNNGLANPDTIVIRFQPSKFFAGSVAGMAPNGWGSFLTVDNVSLEQTNAVEALSKAEAVVHPNPATDELMVDFSGLGSVSIRVMDVAGKEVFRLTEVCDRVRIDVRSWNPGTYFIHLKGGNYSNTVKVTIQD